MTARGSEGVLSARRGALPWPTAAWSVAFVASTSAASARGSVLLPLHLARLPALHPLGLCETFTGRSVVYAIGEEEDTHERQARHAAQGWMDHGSRRPLWAGESSLGRQRARADTDKKQSQARWLRPAASCRIHTPAHLLLAYLSFAGRRIRKRG